MHHQDEQLIKTLKNAYKEIKIYFFPTLWKAGLSFYIEIAIVNCMLICTDCIHLVIMDGDYPCRKFCVHMVTLVSHDQTAYFSFDLGAEKKRAWPRETTVTLSCTCVMHVC